MNRTSSWQGVIDKIQKRLRAWKGNSLSRAGRLTMIKAVLNCMPIYYLSLFRMPKKVSKEIIRIQRIFLWGGSVDGKHMSLVKWDIIQLPKNKGGLGVGNLVIKNAALLFKWWGRYACEEEPLWKRVIQSIHNEDQVAIPSLKPSQVPGPWQAVKKLLRNKQPSSEAFFQQIKVKIGNGSKTRFWEDPWLQCETLKDRFSVLFLLSSQRNVVISSMGWFEGQLWK